MGRVGRESESRERSPEAKLKKKVAAWSGIQNLSIHGRVLLVNFIIYGTPRYWLSTSTPPAWFVTFNQWAPRMGDFEEVSARGLFDWRDHPGGLCVFGVWRGPPSGWIVEIGHAARPASVRSWAFEAFAILASFVFCHNLITFCCGGPMGGSGSQGAPDMC